MIPYKPNPFLPQNPRSNESTEEDQDQQNERRTTLSQNPSMHDLLAWSIENRGRDDADQTNITSTDMDALQVIMGKEDSLRMKELLGIMLDDTAEEDVRIEAAESFLELVEDINNAMNLKNLNMWDPLIGILNNKEKFSPSLRAHSAWILSAAVQNSDAAQNDALDHNLLQVLLGLLETESDWQVRLKVISAVSSLVRNNSVGLRLFIEKKGFALLFQVLYQLEMATGAHEPVIQSHTIALKISFFLSSLLLEDAILPSGITKLQLSQSWIDAGLIEALATTIQKALYTQSGTESKPDFQTIDFLQNVVALLGKLVSESGIQLQSSQVQLLNSTILPIMKPVVDVSLLENLNLKI